MEILLVNDDGYDAEGIRMLKRALTPLGHVTIVAPRESVSAKSCSISIRNGMEFREKEKDVYSLTGFPADCVSFALKEMNRKFDLVVSGCNHGWNLSYDTLYSGTIGACLEALLCGHKALAVSCDFNFSLVEKHFGQVIDFIGRNHLLGCGYFLNINFPAGEEIKDIRLSRLYYRRDHNYFLRKEDGLYWAQRDITDDVPSDSDTYMVNHGIISITPISGSFFDDRIYEQLKKAV